MLSVLSIRAMAFENLQRPASIPGNSTLDKPEATALLIVGLSCLQCRPPGFLPRLFCRTLHPAADHRQYDGGIGTSLPEVIVSLAASLHEQRDLVVGTASAQTLSIYC